MGMLFGYNPPVFVTVLQVLLNNFSGVLTINVIDSGNVCIHLSTILCQLFSNFTDALVMVCQCFLSITFK